MDDVQFLKTEYEVQSYLFFVDSALRDKANYATPSQYTITFDKPFTNVIGLDILQAVIPRTEYLMDHDSNYITYNINNQGWQQLQLDPGDYNIDQLISLLSQGLTGNGIAISCQPVSSTLELKSLLKFTCLFPFKVNMSRTTMRNVIGFANPLTPNPGSYEVPADYEYGKDEIFESTFDTGNSSNFTSFAGPSAILSMFPLTTQVSQTFIAPASGPLQFMSLVCGTVGSPQSTACAISVQDVATGNTVSSGSMILSSDAFASASTSYNVANAEDLLYNRQYQANFQVSGSDSGNCYTAYYNTPTTPTANIQPMLYGNVVQVGQQLCCTVGQGGYSNQIVAPGIYNLVGARYLTIKCPEIEDHLYRDRPFDPFSVGFAKAPLGIFGYGANSYDFSSVPTRTFNPIGRLYQLSFSFIRPDGEIYDFKGTDHTMLLLLRYYAPPDSRSRGLVMAPGYEPDPYKYQARVMREAKDAEYERNRRAIMDRSGRR